MIMKHFSQKKKGILSPQGSAIVQILVALGVLCTMAMTTMAWSQRQLKESNFFEFHAKREQLKVVLNGQVFNNAHNCLCLFQGAAPFPTTGTKFLTGYSQPTEIGIFDPTSCAGGVTKTFLSTTEKDHMRLVSTSLTDIVPNAGAYQGNLNLVLKTTKAVAGPQELTLKIQLVVDVVAAGGRLKFNGCSTGTTEIGMPIYVACRHGEPCDSQAHKLCAAAIPTGNYCLKDLYATRLDLGKRNASAKGYTCLSGPCANGTNSDLRYRSVEE